MPRAIYVEGRGAETFDACLAQFRGAGRLGLVGGLRVLGSSRVMIMARMRDLKARGVTCFDLDTGEADEIELLNAAIQKINGQRALGEDPRRPRRIGAKGGRAKGVAAQRRRDAIMNQDIVRRICMHPKLSWEDREAILGGAPFSASTLRRLYDRD